MFQLSSLAPRPTFTRRTSDMSDVESNQPILAPLSAQTSRVADSYENVSLGQSNRAQRLAEEAALKTSRATERVLPYWREGVFFAFAISAITWLSVLTHRLAGLENLPWCDELIDAALAATRSTSTFRPSKT